MPCNLTFTGADDTRFRALVLARTGLFFSDRRRETFAGSILFAANQAGFASLDEFFLKLQATPTEGDIWGAVISRLTVGETYFFRDPGLMAALREHILPELITRHGTDRSLRLWSAGCATGEEPYTLAILLRELLPDLDHWRILILATDINRQALAQAVAGRFRPWSFRQMDPVIRAQYFTQGDTSFTIDPKLRAMVTFGYLNLAEPAFPSPTNQTDALDLILWRNVSLYLPEPVIREVADRLYDCLSPGGWLVVGPSETNAEIYGKFQMVRFEESFVYRKPHPPMAVFFPSAPVAGARHQPVAINSGHDVLLSRWAVHTTHQTDRAFETPAAFPASPLAQEPAVEKLPAHGHSQGGAARQSSDQEGLVRGQNRYDADTFTRFPSQLEQCLTDASVHHQIARLHANGGRLAEARAWAEQALEQNPLLAEAHYTLALIDLEQGDLESALRRLKKALYLKPDFIMAHVCLADIYSRLGRSREAGRHRSRAIRLASSLPPDTILEGTEELKAGQLFEQA